MASRTTPYNPKALYLLGGLAAALVVVLIVLLIIVGREYRNIGLMRNQIQSLQSDVGLVQVSGEIFSGRKSEVELIDRAFPDEESIPEFIQQLQSVLAANSDSNTYKLVTKAPMIEAGRLVLVWSITAKSDAAKFTKLLTAIERMPYMTHVVSIVGKMPDGPAKPGEYQITLKVYVKTQFSNR
jgi:hypothetical protein